MFPGQQPSSACLRPLVRASEFLLDLAPDLRTGAGSFELAAARRAMLLWRVDGGFGTDPNLCWLAQRGYHFLAKGFAGRRAATLATQVRRWTPYGDAWLGMVASPVDYGRPVRMWVKRRLEKDGYKHSYYVTSLKLPSMTQAMQAYDQRGGAEVEQFRTDKQGLHMAHRRKHRLEAQYALILLTDVAHNLLAHFQATALQQTPFAGFAAKRIVRDLFTIEGRLVWDAGQLVRVELLQAHPYAKNLLPCLRQYCQTA